VPGTLTLQAELRIFSLYVAHETCCKTAKTAVYIIECAVSDTIKCCETSAWYNSNTDAVQ
jgi:hypothetical protein